MHLNLRNVFGFLVLAAAACASWYFSRIDLGLDGVSTGESEGALGYYLRDADISIMDDEGRLLYRISAAAVEERPAENRTVLADVWINYSPAADVPWELRAQSGEIPRDERYLDLSGEVELATTDNSTGEATSIRAPRIRFAPDDFLATTDTDVSVSLGTERLEAVGMTADLKGDYLEFESRVHGEFNP